MDPENGGRASLPVWLAWRLAALLAGLVGAVMGMVFCVGLVVLAWVEVPDASFWSAVSLGLRLWLMGNGAGATLAGIEVTVVPLGLTVANVLALSGLAGLAAQQARESDGVVAVRAVLLRLVGLVAAAYVVCVMSCSFALNTASQSGHALLGSVVIAVVSTLWGATRTLGGHGLGALPDWVRILPRAVVSAIAVLLLTGLLVLVVALARYWPRVRGIHEALAPGGGGAIALVVGQLLWLPNVVIWCASWALGAGIGLGEGTVISPAQNLTGLLPSIPVFGAVPGNGPGAQAALWWLLSGVVAGALAAWQVARARRAARFDEMALVGGLGGVLAGGVFWLLARTSNGDLGSTRLVGIGARLAELAVMAPTVMGISGSVAGLVLGLVRGGSSRGGDGDPRDEPRSPASPLDGAVHRGRGGRGSEAMTDPTVVIKRRTGGPA